MPAVGQVRFGDDQDDPIDGRAGLERLQGVDDDRPTAQRQEDLVHAAADARPLAGRQHDRDDLAGRIAHEAISFQQMVDPSRLTADG